MKSIKSSPEDLTAKNAQLTHSEAVKVISHVQRNDGDWYINTVMIADCDVPFRFKRKVQYQNLKGARVNMTYYPATESVAGFTMEVMNVIRIKRT